MSHLDPDQLALLAIGEPVASPDELEHLASCVACANELAEMRRTVRIARSTLGDEALESPPDHVWTAVAAELGLTATPDAASGADRPRKRSVRRGRRAVWALVASLVILAGAGLGAWAIAARLGPTSIAEASLDHFPSHPHAVGTADVEEARDGSRTLVVTLDGAHVAHTYQEVWLIRNDAGALISLGVLAGDRGSFPIPAGVNLQEYRLVDISAEPVDGNPAHSGDSIVRGALRFA
ncbi:anti-sigma factor [Microbacterium deminutum]|uniref:Anti-sigma K factor RskA C-terminal domain-containing protein n=1 Tax=Microbacterium deminutum TaxID=344164 RepID=A0ABP5CCR0_9MICO